MNLEHAIKILEEHNIWRRDNNAPPKTKMIDPEILGVALDKAIKELKKITESNSKDNVTQEDDAILVTNDNAGTEIEIKKKLFQEFWQKYDKKVGKAKAYVKFMKYDIDLMKVIIDKVPNYIASTPDKKFRKHPLTYLNGECWQDEYEQTSNTYTDDLYF